jgi:ribosomal protein S18 acetylase RimI-like enzyme
MEANLAAHMSGLAAAHPDMTVRDAGRLLLVDSGFPCDTFNFIYRARLDPGSAAGRVAAAVGHFRASGRPFSWWLGPDDDSLAQGSLLEAAGLAHAEDELGMALDLRTLPAPAVPPAGLTVEAVRTPEQLADFARVEAANWDPPDPWVVAFYERVRDLALAADALVRYFVGYADGRPAAAAEVCLAGGLAGVYGVATVAAYRRRGYGTALTLAALHAAARLGYRTAVLQASGEGQGLYARLGFVPCGRFREYK